MTRHIIIFTACFLVGALVTAAIRTLGHDAYTGHQAIAAEPQSPAVHAEGPRAPAEQAHADHAPPAASAPVNSVCALCGMTVNPAIPTATYQGKTIGFGCKACPPRFAADPERYGPAALKNQVVEE